MRIYHNFCVLKSIKQLCHDVWRSYSCLSKKKHPEKYYSAGFGDYCCIPECKSAFYTKCDGKWVKTGISLLKFLRDNSKIKPRKSPKKRCLPATNVSTDNNSYLEEKFERNNSNDSLPVTLSETISWSYKIGGKGGGQLNWKNKLFWAWEQCTESWKWQAIKTIKTSLKIKIIIKKLQVEAKTAKILWHFQKVIWSSVSFIAKLSGFIKIRKKA